jgi:hypothetical protein
MEAGPSSIDERVMEGAMIEFEYLSESLCIHPQDIEDILAILCANGVPQTDVSRKRILDVTRNSVVIVARDVSEVGRRAIVGIATLARIGTLSGTVGYVDFPWIDPKHEDRDLPEELVRRLVEHSFGLDVARVETATSDRPMCRRRIHRSSFIRGLTPPIGQPKKPASG